MRAILRRTGYHSHGMRGAGHAGCRLRDRCFMKKIPVGQTIAFAYRFLLSEIGAIVGIAWVPAVISSAVGYLAQIYVDLHKADIEAQIPQVMGVYLAVSLTTMLVAIFAASMVGVAITQHVLGQRKSGVIAYFAAGRSEWRMFAANIRYLVGAGALIGLAAMISVAAFLLAGVPLDAPEQMRPTAATILAVLISWFVFLYAFVTILRMGFLLPASIVVEEKGGLRRSHELTRGNFWRMFAVILALGVPILLLLMAGEAAVLRSALGPDAARLNPAEFLQRAGQAMEQKLLPWQVFTAVVFVLASGLMYGGSAFAYRALVGTESNAAKRS